MNKKQKEVELAKLSDEERELKRLKVLYNKAANDISEKLVLSNGRINLLLAHYDELDDVQKSILQSQIYQRNFQNSLKKQIDGFLKDLESKQYDSIDSYLKDCYETGFIGTMYDLHGQGIPLIMPIDQKKVAAAIKLDPKISKNLYTKLGEDVNFLKKRIANNISRGIATASEYKVIARNIAADSNVGFNRAMRIARTEGHGVQVQAAVDVQHEAKAKGADIVKQWDAALDGRTRESHRQVDGEIRELDEKFSNNMMYPSDPAGGAAEVVNCRCALLQRAKWALDDDELETLKDRAKYFKLDKTENFEDFKKKYLKAAENVASQATEKSSKTVDKTDKKVYKEGEKLDISNFSPAFTSKSEAKNTQKLIDYVNNLEGANPAVMKLYNSIGKLEKYEKMGIDFKISHASSHAVSTTGFYSGKITEVKLTIPKLSGENLAGQVNTTLHENMHLIDLMLKENPDSFKGKWFSAANTKLVEAFNKTDQSIGDGIKTIFAAHDKEHAAITERLRDVYTKEHEKLVEKYLPNGVWGAGANYKEYQKQQKKLQKKILDEQRDYESRNIMGGGIGNLQDIYDAISGGQFRDNGTVKYGHGSKYYSKSENKILETIANYGSLSVTRPDLVEELRKDKPELVAALDELIEEMGKKVDGIE